MARIRVFQNGFTSGTVDSRLRGNDGRRLSGFSMVEILASMAVLTAGLLFMLAVLQRTLQKGEPLEFEPRAGLLSESILESLRAHPDGGIPFVPGLNVSTWPVILSNTKIYADGTVFNSRGGTYQLPTPFVFCLPGNGIDDDCLLSGHSSCPCWHDGYTGIENSAKVGPDGMDDKMYDEIRLVLGDVIRMPNKLDLDGGCEQDVSEFLLGTGVIQAVTPDTDLDGLPNDTGDSSIAMNYAFYSQLYYNQYRFCANRPDGDFFYDPQREIDEEFSDGEDNNYDGMTDEDTALATQLVYMVFRQTGTSNITPVVGNPYYYDPLGAGNGLDDDGDGEYTMVNGKKTPIDLSTGKIMADGVDNDNDNKGPKSSKTEGIDEGIDEEIYDGKDNDGDGRTDEDCQGSYLPWQPIPFPAPNEEYSFRIMVRRVAAGGDGVDNDGDANSQKTANRAQFWWEETKGVDEEVYDGADNDGDGLTDEDLRAYPAPRLRLITVFVYQGDDRKDNDGDGWVDEEAMDGIDNDLDGNIDKDCYRRVYRTTGLIELPE